MTANNDRLDIETNKTSFQTQNHTLKILIRNCGLTFYVCVWVRYILVLTYLFKRTVKL